MGDDHGIPLGISTGVVIVPEYGRDYDTLFALADSSLNCVKQNGKHGVNIYDHSEMIKTADGGNLEDEIERITKILEERSDRGAFLLGREAFAVAYRTARRLRAEYGGEWTRVMFELSCANDADEKLLPEGSAEFGYMLQRVLRKSDLIMQNKTNQYFVILNKRPHEESEDEVKRVVSEWEKEEYSRKLNVKYACIWDDAQNCQR